MGLAGAALIFGAFLIVYLAVWGLTVYAKRRRARAWAMLPYRIPDDLSLTVRSTKPPHPPGGPPHRRRAA